KGFHFMVCGLFQVCGLWFIVYCIFSILYLELLILNYQATSFSTSSTIAFVARGSASFFIFSESSFLFSADFNNSKKALLNFSSKSFSLITTAAFLFDIARAFLAW